VNNDAISVDKTPIEQAQGPLDIDWICQCVFFIRQPDGQTFHCSKQVLLMETALGIVHIHSPNKIDTIQ
jgi:hypothetical protein